MSMPAKSAVSPIPASHPAHHDKGLRIFTWPKVIFLYPTAIVSLICYLGMWANGDRTQDPTKPLREAVNVHQLSPEHQSLGTQPATQLTRVDRFATPQNLLAMLFLAMFAFNLLVMA